MDLLAPSTARREALVDELLDVFLADGFRAFSIADLAARLRCSKSTLYTVAPSKEQIVVTVVRAFFRRSASRVEERTLGPGDPARRIGAYLQAIAAELAPASPTFFADLDAFAPTRELYRRNTEIAARRVQQLVAEGVASGRLGALNATFVGAVAGHVMEAIHRGDIEGATGLDDSAAYRALADLIVAGVA